MAEARAALSLRSRLLLSLLGPLAVILATSVVADYRVARGLANRAYDQVLMHAAMALASRLEHDGDDGTVEADVPQAAAAILRTDPGDTVYYAVVDAGGRLIAGDAVLRGHAAAPAAGESVFSDARIAGRPMRLVTYGYGGPPASARVVVGHTTHERDDTAAGILRAVIWPNLLLVSATLLIVWIAVRFSLGPLDALGRQIARRAEDDFNPVDDHRVPAETRPLVRSINQLMASLREASRAQQAFLSNAAHQLRTPLAALQTQLELAAGDPPAEARPRLARLRESVQGLTHFVRQMLALARSSPEAASAIEQHPVALETLLEECASAQLDRALAGNIDLGFEAGPARVRGSTWLLRELLANLVDNAIAYTPPGGHVTVRCGDGGPGPWLEVEDDGPGIPAAARERVFERFYRAPGTTAPGSGLGLAVVREVADRHAATVAIGEGAHGRGTRVRVSFPPCRLSGS